ncbi:MAG TPA: ABC transporter permease, partial [Anaerolineales bacterium]|nr:ABC transporter permease [Anaerolineales bacterium]
IRKEFIQIFRDPRTLALILVMPIIQLFLLGYAATTNVKNVPIAVWDQSRSPESRSLLDAFRAADYFTISFEVYSQEEIQTLVEQGDVRGALVIPPDYARTLLEGNAQVSMILDGSDATVGSTALSTARLIGQSHSIKVLTEQAARQGRAAAVQPPLDVRTQVWYNPDLRSAYFMIPGVIGMVLYAIMAMLTATAVVRERERGTIEQLIVTPIRSWELIVGKVMPYVILGFFDLAEVLLIGYFWFDVPIRSNLFLVVGTAGLLLLSSLGIGLFASTIANTQQEALLTVFVTILPGVFISGFLFPLEAMPKFLQIVSYAIPLRYYLVIVRSLLLKGVGFAALQNEIISLALFGVIIMGAAALRFRKRLD